MSRFKFKFKMLMFDSIQINLREICSIVTENTQNCSHPSRMIRRSEIHFFQHSTKANPDFCPQVAI